MEAVDGRKPSSATTIASTSSKPPQRAPMYVLDDVCGLCDGAGMTPWPEWDICPWCEGTGYPDDKEKK